MSSASTDNRNVVTVIRHGRVAPVKKKESKQESDKPKPPKPEPELSAEGCHYLKMAAESMGHFEGVHVERALGRFTDTAKFFGLSVDQEKAAGLAKRLKNGHLYVLSMKQGIVTLLDDLGYPIPKEIEDSYDGVLAGKRKNFWNGEGTDEQRRDGPGFDDFDKHRKALSEVCYQNKFVINTTSKTVTIVPLVPK